MRIIKTIFLCFLTLSITFVNSTYAADPIIARDLMIPPMDNMGDAIDHAARELGLADILPEYRFDGVIAANPEAAATEVTGPPMFIFAGTGRIYTTIDILSSIRMYGVHGPAMFAIFQRGGVAGLVTAGRLAQVLVIPLYNVIPRGFNLPNHERILPDGSRLRWEARPENNFFVGTVYPIDRDDPITAGLLTDYDYQAADGAAGAIYSLAFMFRNFFDRLRNIDFRNIDLGPVVGAAGIAAHTIFCSWGSGDGHIE